MDMDFGSYTTTEIISIIVDMLLDMMNNPAYPDFLTYGEQGVEEVQVAGATMGLGFIAAHETIENMRNDMGDQEVLGSVDYNENGIWDYGEPYIVPVFGELDSDEEEALAAFDQLFFALGQSFLDYTEYDNDPQSATPFCLCELNPLFDVLNIPLFFPDIDLFTIDIGALYVDPDTDFIRDELKLILNLLALVLPPPPPY